MPGSVISSTSAVEVIIHAVSAALIVDCATSPGRVRDKEGTAPAATSGAVCASALAHRPRHSDPTPTTRFHPGNHEHCPTTGAGNPQCTSGVQSLQLRHSKARFGVPSEGPEETLFLPINKFQAPNEVRFFPGAGDPSAFFLPVLRWPPFRQCPGES